MVERQHGLASQMRLVLAVLALTGCAGSPHREAKNAPDSTAGKPSAEAPLQPNSMPLMPPPPRQNGKTETYSVTVNDVPLTDVLFVLARDAKLSLDIDPRVKGRVTLIAADQTLQQILARVAEQVDMRYEVRDSTIVVRPDTPFDRQYKIDYVNMARESKSASNIATQIQASSGGAIIAGSTGASGSSGSSGSAGGSGGDEANNNSTAELTNVSRNQFWYTLIANVKSLVGDNISINNGQRSGLAAVGQGAASSASTAAADARDSMVIANPETGILVVRATSRQQVRVQEFLDIVMRAARRQVLIEATVVEVQLSNQYQQGINWQHVGKNGLTLTQQPQGPGPLPGGSIPGSGPGGITYPASATPLATPSMAVLQFVGNLSAAVSLLESFGTVKVLSSPKLSVLNNQTAFLKVVDNRIYFTIGVQITPGSSVTGTQAIVTYTSVPATVPVGFVMSVTPSIDEMGMVMMDVRPTISRIIDYVNDPNPALAQANVVSQIPEIQTREIESLLRVKSGDIAVMGGLMQDVTNNNSDEVPFAGQIPVIGNLFKYKNNTHTKSELVIFLRPVVIRDASLEGDYSEYKGVAQRDGLYQGGTIKNLSFTGTP
jgi:general secretion pathway protein D